MISGTTVGLGVQLLISLAMSSSSSSSTSENEGSSNSDDENEDAFEKEIKMLEDAEVLEWTLFALYRLCLHNACSIPMLQVMMTYEYPSPLSRSHRYILILFKSNRCIISYPVSLGEPTISSLFCLLILLSCI